MTRQIRGDFKTTLASLLLDDIQFNRNSYYYFLGKTDPWGNPDIPPDYMQMTSAVDLIARNNATFFKKIDKNDISLAVLRKDWVYGEIVEQWDTTKDMQTTLFYRLVDEQNVYICLDNAENSESIVAPAGTSYLPIRTADGYLWKFVYQIPPTKKRSFVSNSYMPIQRALSDSFYSRGAIESVNVIDGGNGYTADVNTYVDIYDVGCTSGSGASFSVVNVDAEGKITEVQQISGGQAYTAGCTLTLASVSGVGANLAPIISNGQVVDVTINDGGYGYSIGDVITAVVGGATMRPIMQKLGKIIDVEIIEAGTGYILKPQLFVRYYGVQNLGTPTGEFSSNQTALLQSVIYDGKLVKVLIEDAGINYPCEPSTQIIVHGDGSGAEFRPVIVDGQITNVVVESPGEGYTYATFTVGGSGTGGALSGIIGSNDFIGAQSIIEQTAIPGAIYSIKVITPGQNYNVAPQITVSGDGVGCTASVVLDPVTNGISRIIVASAGRNYTYATVQFSGSGSGASAYAVLAPAGGHGADIVQQIGQNILAISQQLNTEQSFVTSGQQFRQFGLLRNPRTTWVGKIFRGSRDISAYDIEYRTESNNQLIVGDVVTNESTKYVVLSASSNRAMLQPISALVETPLGILELEQNSLMQYTCTGIIKEPMLNKYTGQLLYIGDEQPFSFSADQGLLVKTFLKF